MLPSDRSSAKSTNRASTSTCDKSPRLGKNSTLSRMTRRAAASLFVLGTGVTALDESSPAMMGMDRGNMNFKVTLIEDRKHDLALNIHSQRKTPSAVSFAGKVRTYGDQAIASQNKQDTGAFSYINRLLGLSAADCDKEDPKECLGDVLGLDRDYYQSYGLHKNETRGTFELLTDKQKEEKMSLELITANILQYARGIAEDKNDGKAIRDAVITVPTNWNQRQRQALQDAAKIAGLNSLLIHETPAAAVNLAMDWAKDTTENVLFYNMGARTTEVCIAEFSPRQAGMVAGRTTPAIVMKGCVHDERIGGHLGDIAIADEMKKRFIKKFPKLSDIEKHPRALRKLLGQALKSRHQLSAGKDTFFSVEGLYEEKDFQTKMTRAEFEDLEMMKQMWSILTEPIDAVLAKAQMTLKDIDLMEIVGMAWRMPKVQEILNDYFSKAQEARKGKDQLVLGQHLNGDETFVLGASLFAANHSRAVRPPKRVFFQDTTHDHNYTIDLLSLSDETPIKNTTDIASLGSRYGVKKKITVSDAKQDFTIKLFENGKWLTSWTITGLEEAIEKDYAHVVNNSTNPAPKVAFTIGPDASGVIGISKKVEALFVEEVEEEVVDEEAMAARRKRKLEKERKAKKANETNSTTNSTEDSAETNSTTEEKKDETGEKKEESTEEKKDEDGTTATDEKKDETTSSTEEKKETEETSTEEKKAEEESAEEKKSDGDSAGASEEKKDETAKEDAEKKSEDDDLDDDKPIMKTRMKKKNHIISLKVNRDDAFPKPMTPEEITFAQDMLFKMTKHDAESAEMDEVKNDLESFFYEAREKLEYNDAYKTVTTEEQRKELLDKVQETETWTEDEITKDTSLAEIKEKLKALEELMIPIKARAIEFDSRADFIVLMDKEVGKIEDLKTKVKGMPWLKAEEVDKALKKVEDFAADWDKKKAEQAAKPGHEEPVFTKAQIEGYFDRSTVDLKKLSKVKKPKERKTKTRGAGKKAAKEDPRTEEQLQEELKKVEKELEDIKAKKMEAVTKEDYDEADKLKQEEKTKNAAVESLNAAMEALKAKTADKEKKKDSGSSSKEAGEKKTETSSEEKKKSESDEDANKSDSDATASGDAKKEETSGEKTTGSSEEAGAKSSDEKTAGEEQQEL
ncbi:unnamed protein product [Amoebophrya sp. A120]|nr:unnamed protein product [Amoebophrya sp. A120]|eukprot:GSA120T00017262001.1